jgi:hypothetical protein
MRASFSPIVMSDTIPVAVRSSIPDITPVFIVIFFMYRMESTQCTTKKAAMNIIEAEITFKKEFSQYWPCYHLDPIEKNNYRLEITFTFQDEMMTTALLFDRFSTIHVDVQDEKTIILS